MDSQPQNPEFRNNPENFHPCIYGKHCRFLTHHKFTPFSEHFGDIIGGIHYGTVSLSQRIVGIIFHLYYTYSKIF